MEDVTISRLERKVLSLDALKKGILVVLFALFTGLSAHVRIYFPFSPVPFTLQTLAVLLSGIVLKEFGSTSQILYVILGIAGANLFAGGGSLAYISSPTFGYLIGFIFASYLAGYCTRKFTSNKAILFGLFLSNLVVYIPGLLGLFLSLSKSGSSVGIIYLLNVGFLPFIVGDMAKLFLAFGFAKGIKRI